MACDMGIGGDQTAVARFERVNGAEDFRLVSFNFVENPDPAHSSKLRQRYAEKGIDESLYETIVLRGKKNGAT